MTRVKKSTSSKDKSEPKPLTSKSQKAGLVFPVARINRFLKKNTTLKRVGSSAPIYMTAVIEYIVNEIIEIAGNITSDASRKTVSPEDLVKALRGDKDLAKLFNCQSVFVGDKLNKVTETITYSDKSNKKK